MKINLDYRVNTSCKHHTRESTQTKSEKSEYSVKMFLSHDFMISSSLARFNGTFILTLYKGHFYFNPGKVEYYKKLSLRDLFI